MGDLSRVDVHAAALRASGRAETRQIGWANTLASQESHTQSEPDGPRPYFCRHFHGPILATPRVRCQRMTTPNPSLDPSLFSDLEFRGLVKQVTDPELALVLSKEPLTLYVGFDPTSDSLHVGSLLPLLVLRRFQEAGHKVIAVVGGATGMIGDPSGKSQERALQGPEQLEKNVQGVTRTLARFLRLSGPNAALVLNNAEFFKNMSFIDFLRDVGKHFTINHMMAKESVRARLEDRDHGISYTEFSYMLLQAYDFYMLNQRHHCRLQVGGSDQWGNITAGTELIRRMRAHAGETLVEGQESYGLTHPLVTKSDGSKFGKTESGAVWLDAEKTSPYEFYQFFVQTPDADALTYLKYFTFLSHAEIEGLAQAIQSAPEKREAQTRLARELTLLVHGEEGLNRAEAATRALFGTEIRELDAKSVKELFKGAPSTTIHGSRLDAEPGILLVDALAETGLCPSKGQARKDVQAGGIYVNNERVQDVAAKLERKDLIAGSVLVLRKGKKTYHLITVE